MGGYEEGGSAVHMIGLKGDKYRSREGYFVILNSRSDLLHDLSNRLRIQQDRSTARVKTNNYAF